MARRRTMVDIQRNEKYMDDAVSSALFNLHKAAQRKAQYIWATKGFSSLDCIYNNKNTNNSKSCEASQRNLKNSAQKKDKKKTVYFVSESKYSDLINGKLLSNAKISDLTEANQLLNTNKLCESGVELNGGSRISEEEKIPGINSIKISNELLSPFSKEQTSCYSEISMSARDVALNKNMKSSNYETEMESNYEKSKMISPDIQQKKSFEKTRNNIYWSSSVNSLFPEQKPVENEKYTRKNYNCEIKTMLLLKIFNNKSVYDFVVELKDFERMIKRFPKLKEVFPEIDKEKKEVEFSADAVKVVYGFLRSHRYDAPDEITSVEVLAAFKLWEMYQFRVEFQNGFIANLSKKSNLAYRAAVHYGLEELCDVFKRFSGSDLSCNDRPYRPRKCCISVSTYVEPQEFHIPLKIATSTHQDNFDREIKNEIAFKAIGGSYIITGFHILLNVDDKRNTDPVFLSISTYVVRNQQNYYEELDIRKPLRSIIAINFRKSVEVEKDQTVEIVVESTLKPYLCRAIQGRAVTRMGNEGQFSINLKSNFKVVHSNDLRFFIGKLMYYPKT